MKRRPHLNAIAVEVPYDEPNCLERHPSDDRQTVERERYFAEQRQMLLMVGRMIERKLRAKRDLISVGEIADARRRVKRRRTGIASVNDLVKIDFGEEA